MTTRQEKVKELLKVEVSNIIQKEMKNPRLVFVTVTDAEVSKDLRHARVFISVLGGEEQRQESLAILQKAAGFIRGQFSHHVALKAIPEISFKLDAAVEQGSRIFELLQQVKHEPEEPTNGNDS